MSTHPYIPAANTIKAVLNGSQAGQPIANIFHFVQPSPVTPLDLSNLATAVRVWWNTWMKPLQAPQYTADSLDMTDLTTVSGPTFTLVGGMGAGAHGGTACPNNVALVGSHQTALRGRSFRGRTYMAGVPLTVLATTRDVDPAILPSYTAMWTALTSGIFAPAWAFAIVSYRNLGAWRTSAVVTPVTTSTCDGRLDTQRRRLG